MKKKGFTILEVAVAFLIFLVAFVPLNQMMRGLVLAGSSYKRVAPEGGSGEESDGTLEIDEDFVNGLLDDLKTHAKWGGYNFLDGLIKTGTEGKRTYKFSEISGNAKVSEDCDKKEKSKNYILKIDTSDVTSPTGNDYLTKDPSQNNESNSANDDQNCYLKTEVANAGVSGRRLILRVYRGEIKNLRTLPTGQCDIVKIQSSTIKSPNMIYAELYFEGNESETRTFVMTPLQDLCIK